MLGDLKTKLGVTDDTHIPAEELKKLCAEFKKDRQKSSQKRLPGQSDGTTLGRYRCGVCLLER